MNDFVLGDFNEKLPQVGRCDVRRQDTDHRASSSSICFPLPGNGSDHQVVLVRSTSTELVVAVLERELSFTPVVCRHAVEQVVKDLVTFVDGVKQAVLLTQEQRRVLVVCFVDVEDAWVNIDRLLISGDFRHCLLLSNGWEEVSAGMVNPCDLDQKGLERAETASTTRVCRIG